MLQLIVISTVNQRAEENSLICMYQKKCAQYTKIIVESTRCEGRWVVFPTLRTNLFLVSQREHPSIHLNNVEKNNLLQYIKSNNAASNQQMRYGNASGLHSRRFQKIEKGNCKDKKGSYTKQ